jgi:hypothetical protein
MPSANANEPERLTTHIDLEGLYRCYPKLPTFPNKAVERRHNVVSKYDTLRYLAIERYFELINVSNMKMSASLNVAKIFFPKIGLHPSSCTK